MKKTIRILTLHYPPDIASASLLMEELANGLKDKNYNIEVLTSQPIYNTETKSKEYEKINGVNIYRIESSGLNKNLKYVKILNSIWFFLNICMKLLFSEDSKNVIYLLTSNPPILPLFGLLIKMLKGNKFVLLLYDINPDASEKLGYVSKNSIIVKLWIYFNELVFKKSKYIIVMSEQMKTYVLESYLKNDLRKSDKIHVIHNWADPKFIKPLNKDDSIFIKNNNLTGKFVINYSGNIGIAQKFDGLLKASLLLRDFDIAFIFFGDGVNKKRIMEFVEQNRLSNFYFQGYKPKQVLNEVLSASDVSVVHLESEVERFCMPSKLYYIIATGKPILAFCNKNSDLGKIINEAQCGFIVSHNEPEEIARIIMELKSNKELRDRMSLNGRSYFLEHFTLEIAIEKYNRLFSAI